MKLDDKLYDALSTYKWTPANDKDKTPPASLVIPFINIDNLKKAIKEWAESCVPKIDVNKINFNLSSDSEAIVKLKYAREVLKNIKEG